MLFRSGVCLLSPQPASQSDARHRLNEIYAAKEAEYLGPKCFGPAIRKEPFPTTLSNVAKTMARYNGAAKPNTWLQDYVTLVGIHGGNSLIAVRFLPIMLEGTARLWIYSLPENTIHNWRDMEKMFSQHFQGTYKRPKTLSDLQRCTQQKDETMRDFVSRWIETKNMCEGISEAQAMHAFIEGLRKGTLLRHELKRHEPKTLGEMLTTASEYAAADDDACSDGEVRVDNILKPNVNSKAKDSNKRKPNNDKAGPSTEVAATFDKPNQKKSKWKKKPRAEPREPRITYEQAKNGPCYFHSQFGPPNHTTAQCRFMEDFKNDPEVGYKGKRYRKNYTKEKKEDDMEISESEEDEPRAKKGNKYPKATELNHTFLGTPSAKEEKRANHEQA